MLPLFESEKNLFFALNSLHADWLNPIMQTLSGELIWIPVLCLYSFYIYKNILPPKWPLALFYFCLMFWICDSSTSYLFKNIFLRLRPCRIPEVQEHIYQFGQKCGGKYGFFSAHSSNAFATIFFLNSMAQLKKPIIILSVFFATLVGYSRLYLGVHFPLDIFVGALWGILLSQAFLWTYRHS